MKTTDVQRKGMGVWQAGDTDIIEAIEQLKTSGEAGAILQISTPTLAPSARLFSAEEEDALMLKAWSLTLAKLPGICSGKRSGWREFLFVLRGDREEAVERTRSILVGLQEDLDLDKLVWRLVLCPIHPLQAQSLRLSEPEEHDVTANTHRSIAIWVEGPLESARVTILN